MKTDILTIPTVTLALKAKRLLSKKGIKSKVIKIDSTSQKNGCAYAIEFNSLDFFSVVTIIRDAEIPYGRLGRSEEK